MSLYSIQAVGATLPTYFKEWSPHIAPMNGVKGDPCFCIGIRNPHTARLSADDAIKMVADLSPLVTDLAVSLLIVPAHEPNYEVG